MAPCADKLADEGEISCVRTGSDSILMVVEGPKKILADVAELLGWMTSAFQTTAGGVFSSLISFGQIPTVHGSTPLFRFSVSGRESPRLSGACWLPLVRQSVIASGFEVPARAGQKGLELSFDDLIAICGIEYPVDRDEKIIFLGLSTILVPTAIFDDCSIQWHVIIAETPNRLQKALHGLDCSVSIFHARYMRDFKYDTHDTYNMPPTSPTSSKGETITGLAAFLSRLREARHFLGWCKEVDVLLGTAAGQYDSVSWTAATESKTRKTASADAFTLGTGGKGIFGASYSRSYMITQNRDQRFPFANRKAKYEEALNNHKEEQIILYDPEERRGWLVPLLSVLLHIVILRLKWDDYTGPLPYAKPTWDGAIEALQALRGYRSLPLHTEDNHDPYRLEDLTKLLMFALQNAYPTKASSTIGGGLVFADSSFTTPSSVILNEGAVVFGNSSRLRNLRELVTALCGIVVPTNNDQRKESRQPPCVRSSEGGFDIIAREPSPCLYQGNRLPGRSLLVPGSTQPTPQESERFGDLSYALGGYSSRQEGGESIDGPIEQLKPNIDVVGAMIEIAMSTGRPQPNEQDSASAEEEEAEERRQLRIASPTS
ncbi:hypothetical protein DL769_010445 [Monosporascus sp. CRB-8-3]|nr:hypothetical protein DL769_010445 [Monosporascus sp. CRB-8-3]